MKNIKLIIEYDGTNYHGWQIQKNADTIQGILKDTIKTLTGEEVTLNGSGRTDSKVHAYEQVANFKTSSNIPAQKFSYALNSMLPKDIVIKKSERVEMDFHARFNVQGKMYRYLIYNSKFPSAILRDRAWHISYNLNFEDMKRATAFFMGTHDFSAFKASGSSVKSSIRTITYISLDKNDDIISLEIAGDGFLYNMVRIITGTLIDVGMGKIKPENIKDIIEGLDRKRAGKTAVPEGLYLVKVYY
ncbi:tRNA pseudouridine(38-40) synthase TruA [Herbivorax sp. ANBcel31]|uniref:tRNA pseudouridine(38-40) synthase TruA n=1 Tax=Herbivorax sp. ANBcel31 TaxID=3069754 RepID=UPI0027B065ED|nr:tRNA pseudouridine(38-40) synthase TruA [Herbivorax sp. ANBcel31]MDQ2087617.1 tRNA pseudouridine(38-40) synthase TruA [Herbivorax sp. ANBcel31]